MRAWLLDAFDGVRGLRLGEAPSPKAQSGEVVLDLHYAALNPADRYLAERQYPAEPPLPHVLGRDGSGTVVDIGPDVHDLAPGDRRLVLRGDVGVTRHGTFAERVAVPAQNLVAIPSSWDEDEAAGAALVCLTAHQALTMWGALARDSVVLVTGASGGVGIAVVQLALAMGSTVIALSRSEEKRKRLLELGASGCFDPNEPTWRSALKKQLAPRQVDLAIDNIGGKLLPEVIDTLGDRGKLSLVGRLAGPVPSFNTASLFFRRLRMGGVAVGANSSSESRAAWLEVVDLLSRAHAKPIVDRVFAFEELPQAFERLAEGPMGKVLLRIKP